MLAIADQVIVHPLVLLSVVDHYQRASLGPGRRVVGVMLGHWVGRTVHITNSYAAKEQPVGWYHSGPKLQASDVKIHTMLREYCPSPVLCIIDAKCSTGGMPVQAYSAFQDDPSQPPTFTHIACLLEADEPEAVGVEHLLRELRGPAGTLSHSISTKTKSLKELDAQLGELDAYLAAVSEGRLPVRQDIVAAAQDMFNLLPDVHSEVARMALTVKTNDQLAMIYLGTMTRAAIAINDLINNKVQAANASAPNGTLSNALG